MATPAKAPKAPAACCAPDPSFLLHATKAPKNVNTKARAKTASRIRENSKLPSISGGPSGCQSFSVINIVNGVKSTQQKIRNLKAPGPPPAIAQMNIINSRPRPISRTRPGTAVAFSFTFVKGFYNFSMLNSLSQSHLGQSLWSYLAVPSTSATAKSFNSMLYAACEFHPDSKLFYYTVRLCFAYCIHITQ